MFHVNGQTILRLFLQFVQILRMGLKVEFGLIGTKLLKIMLKPPHGGMKKYPPLHKDNVEGMKKSPNICKKIMLEA